MTFSGMQDKCKACDKTMHSIDLLTADSIPYHKSCFRCSHCKGTLSMCSYSSMDGVLYRKTHFEQLFKATGTFSKNFPTGTKANNEQLINPYCKQSKIPPTSYPLFSVELRTSVLPARRLYPLEKVQTCTLFSSDHNTSVLLFVCGGNNCGSGIERSSLNF
ncbi:LIM domain-containing protein PLIM2c [Dichanthelium oligosanthes]|uniref:LIM domain-containing protein PLIM2c n=1 Tax=Dichanthelium oligosanthes TaxID=888268 RepID=A0A1E5UQJ0_9POAL|nr:LIM domain-containing protein PLIM2c [Dichanthelium oligosanthes]